MRVLQIGVGRWGRNHVRAWRALGVELAVCDERAEQLEGLEVPCSTDSAGLLERADAVDIVTPAPSHAPLVREALSHGKDVFVEKPFTVDSAEGFELAALAVRRGAILQVGHVFRFAPESAAVREALRQGRVGRVRYLLSHFMGFKRPRSDGGVAVSDGIHFVDLCSWLLGKQPGAVTAVLRDQLGRGLDDVALMTLEYGDEIAHVEAGYFPPEARRDLEVMGTGGGIVCDFLAKSEPVRCFGHLHRQDASGSWSAVEGERTLLEVAREEPLLAELRAFTQACAERRPSAIAADGFAGAAAVAVIEAAQRSSATGTRVELKLPVPAEVRS